MTAVPKIDARLDALPDIVDFRDRFYTPALVEVPRVREIDRYRGHGLPVLDQGREGACTGFALAAIANYLLSGRGRGALDDEVSARMFYVMAKRYDEWPGEDYSGSSARGAMKGWHKHGVCAARLWKDATEDESEDRRAERAAEALARPLGAYYRVDKSDLIAMHAALTEVGILYATARVHKGWQEVAPGDRDIRWRDDLIGGHAFAIVGYDREGFWIQNSWGPDWGDGGFARMSYGDWLVNGSDVWVAALGVPIETRVEGTAALGALAAEPSQASAVYARLRPHIVTSKNDGILDDKGTYGLTQAGLKHVIEVEMPAKMADWDRKRLVMYAHGGLVTEAKAVLQASAALDVCEPLEVYPVNFIWRSGFLTTLGNILREAIGSRSEGLESLTEIAADLLDDLLEVGARHLGGRLMWDEMKENAVGATERELGAARLTADLVAPMRADGRIEEVHLVGHSAGAVFLGALANRLGRLGVTIDSLTLWAPACTMTRFKADFLPLIEAGRIRRFTLYTLDDRTERDDDCLGIYKKSLLYLVSRALEKHPRIRLRTDGEPLLGLQLCAEKDLPRDFWDHAGRTWHVAPRNPISDARHHGDFNDDPNTLASTFGAIAGLEEGTSIAVAGRRSAMRSRHAIQAAFAMPRGRADLQGRQG